MTKNIKYRSFILLKTSMFLLLILFLAVSCKTTRLASTREIRPMSAERIIKRVERASPDYNYYTADRVNIIIDAMGEKNTVTAQFKIKKDEKILVNLRKMGFPIGRALLTPDSVFAVNFIERNYVAGTYQTMQKLFGFQLDFEMIQAVLTADASKLIDSDISNRDFTSSIVDQQYRINSEFNRKISRALSRGNNSQISRQMDNMDDSEFLDISAWVDPDIFMIRKVEMKNIKSQSAMKLEYDNMELTGRQHFPTSISLDYSDKNREMKVQLKIGKISTQKERDFSFTIPEKFEKFND